MKSFSFILLLLSLGLSSLAQAKNFSKKCKNIRLGGNFLKATCSNDRGHFIPSDLKLEGIENVFGKLTISKDNSDKASFFRTCEGVTLKKNLETNQIILFGSCFNGRTGHVDSELCLDEHIHIKNGHLTWDR